MVSIVAKSNCDLDYKVFFVPLIIVCPNFFVLQLVKIGVAVQDSELYLVQIF